MAQGGWEMMGGGWCWSVRLDDRHSFERAIRYFLSYVIGVADDS